MADVLVTVQAVVDFPFRDRLVHAGELVTMRAAEAAAASRRGHVSLTRPRRGPTAPPEPDPPAPPPEKGGRRYRRRDLQPEP